MSNSNNSTSAPFSISNGAGMGSAFVCEVVGRVNSKGIWLGDDPLSFSVPLLLLQLSIISIFTRFIYVFLKPFGQPSIVSQIIGGVVLGPSVLGHNLNFAEKMFPLKGGLVLETMSVFGFMLFIFLIGVKTDPSILFRAGKRVVVIGTLAFCIPYGIAGLVKMNLCESYSLNKNNCKLLERLVVLQSLTSFPVVATFLAELNILNSEIGRLATSSAMICDLFFWFTMSLTYVKEMAVARSTKISIESFISVACLFGVIAFGVRPAALWAVRNTPEGKPVKEIYTTVALIALMGCVFMGEIVGLDPLISSFLVGLAIPDGPPLGAALVERLDCFVSVLLTPIFFTLCGLKTNVYTIQKWHTVGITQLIVLAGFCAKLIGTMIPPLFCRMPFRDAFSLGLIMNSRGIVELILLNDWRTRNVLNDESFAIMVVSVVTVTGAISPLVKALYDPSRRFLAYKRRTIQHHGRNQELRMLACIHSQENVHTVVTLLSATNPSKQDPVGLFVLHLIKLAGRASSLLIPHIPHDKPPENPTQSEKIFSAFETFQHVNCGNVALNCYKGISPSRTMHNDVCSLALEERITFIIMPFHTQTIDNKTIESSHSYRHLNMNVLDKAPCSVGILVDRSNPKKSSLLLEETLSYKIIVLFFGGADDREALAYGRRMLKHPCVSVSVLHFKISLPNMETTARIHVYDAKILDEFRFNLFPNARISYEEKVVTDRKGIIDVIEAIDESYDLVMVGKQHENLQVLSEFGTGSEDKELGEIGEIVATGNSKLRASVLVVQQQKRVWGMRNPVENPYERYISIIRNKKQNDFCVIPSQKSNENFLIPQ
ncbi:cation/H(+) antiporter 15-like [Euphorbia lathyris]|uniref:cation/H(+) antiporter 15-like n=1 Tax=Euphorbia lathyris TaxID=212925 RepID=UPI0033137F3C